MANPRHPRRQWLRTASALALGACLDSTQVLAKDGKRPNILFILADDMGYADLSVYGQTDYQTPHLDRLAAQGVRLTQAYSNSAVCSATRFGLITGRYLPAAWRPGRADCRGIQGNGAATSACHPALAIEASGLQHGLGWQMASGHFADLWPA